MPEQQRKYLSYIYFYIFNTLFALKPRVLGIVNERKMFQELLSLWCWKKLNQMGIEMRAEK